MVPTLELTGELAESFPTKGVFEFENLQLEQLVYSNNNKVFIIHAATKRVKVKTFPATYNQQFSQ